MNFAYSVCLLWRLVALVFDEMEIWEYLIFDKTTGMNTDFFNFWQQSLDEQNYINWEIYAFSRII